MKRYKIKCLRQRVSKPMSCYVVLVTTMLIVLGCSHTEKVLVPPRVELNLYNSIGVIEFSTNAEETLKPYITQNFIQNIQLAQPGIRVLELGDKNQILRSLGQGEFNPDTIRSIGQRYKVDALILGHFEVSEIKPKVNINTVAKVLNAKAYVEASLRTRILETDSGATCWTRATSGKSQIAKINVLEGDIFALGISDPREKYGKLVPDLVYANTSDFRSYYEYRTVKK